MQSRDVIEILSDWPQPGTGNDGPVVHYGRGATRLAYDTPDEMVAVVTFPICQQLICGHPNDEVLQGHPLYEKGLQFYSVHRVLHSSRLAELEQANSVHPRHDPVSYLRDKEHWVFTFQDGTVELLVSAPASSKPFFKLYESWLEANQLFATGEA